MHPRLHFTMPSASLFSPVSRAGRRTVVALALAQALLLLAFHEAIAREWAITNNFVFNTAYLTLALAVPSALYLLLDDPRRPQPWLFVGGMALVLLPLALYVGAQCAPEAGVLSGSVLWPYGLSMALAWFISLAFMQAAQHRTVFHYPTLFAAGWNHALALALTALFIGLFWLVLLLWMALFDVLGVGFFERVFEDRRFAYAATGLVGGIGLVLVRGYLGATDALLRVVLALLKALLPLLSLIALLFLAALPFTGLEPLWDTGRPTLLMSILLALMVGFLNGAVQDGRGRPPYPVPLRRFIEAAVIVLPAYAALSGYALHLRIGQYGWTVPRVWAVLTVALLGAYALAYAGAALRQRGRWMRGIRPANIALAGAMLFAIALTHTPVLDPTRITTRSQTQRLRAGTAEPSVLAYLRFEAGERGFDALRRLQTEQALAGQPRLAARLDTVLSRRQMYDLHAPVSGATPAQLRAAIEVVPDTQSVPAALWSHLAGEVHATECLRMADACLLLRADVYGDARPEYVLFQQQRHFAQPFIYATAEDDTAAWRQIGQYDVLQRSAAGLIDSLRAGRYRVAPSEWRDLVVGDERLRVQ